MIYGQDSFTGADNTALTSHTPDVGTSWDSESAGIQIESNKATASSFSGGSSAISDGVAVDDYQVSAVFYNDAMFNFDEVHIFARGNNSFPWFGYSACYDVHDDDWQICYLSGTGAKTVLVSTGASFSTSSSQAVTLVVEGDAISLYLDSTLTLTTTDSTLTSGGFAGVRILSQNDFDCSVDDFLVEDIAGGGAGTHTLTGASSTTIATPGAISLTLDSVPVWVVPGKMVPSNYFHMGLLAWGDDNGEMRPEPIIFVNQLFVLPAGMTTLYWWLEPGVTGTAVELAGP